VSQHAAVHRSTSAIHKAWLAAYHVQQEATASQQAGIDAAARFLPNHVPAVDVDSASPLSAVQGGDVVISENIDENPPPKRSCIVECIEDSSIINLVPLSYEYYRQFTDAVDANDVQALQVGDWCQVRITNHSVKDQLMQGIVAAVTTDGVNGIHYKDLPPPHDSSNSGSDYSDECDSDGDSQFLGAPCLWTGQGTSTREDPNLFPHEPMHDEHYLQLCDLTPAEFGVKGHERCWVSHRGSSVAAVVVENYYLRCRINNSSKGKLRRPKDIILRYAVADRFGTYMGYVSSGRVRLRYTGWSLHGPSEERSTILSYHVYDRCAAFLGVFSSGRVARLPRYESCVIPATINVGSDQRRFLCDVEWCVVLTGTFPGLGGGSGLQLGKAALQTLVEDVPNCRVVSALSSKVTHLVLGNEPGQQKILSANRYRLCIIQCAEFLYILKERKKMVFFFVFRILCILIFYSLRYTA
jgi:hypothetical protein